MNMLHFLFCCVARRCGKTTYLSGALIPVMFTPSKLASNDLAGWKQSELLRHVEEEWKLCAAMETGSEGRSFKM